MHRTFQERGYCSRAGYARIDEVLGELCRLGNAALQERRDAWKTARTRISYQDQCRSLTQVRADDPDGFGRLNVAMSRGALQRVDRAYQAFFRRCRTGGKPGYPRFRSHKRYTTIELNDVTPSQLRRVGRRTFVAINGLPAIELRPRRTLPDAKPRTIRITRRGRGVTVDLVYKHDGQPMPKTGESVGIDLGVRKRLTLSTGETIAPEPTNEKAIRRAQPSSGPLQARQPGPAQARRNPRTAATTPPGPEPERLPPAHHRAGTALRHHRPRGAAGRQHDPERPGNPRAARAERPGEGRAQPFHPRADLGAYPRAAPLQGSMGR